jgi:hypothetical protein
VITIWHAILLATGELGGQWAAFWQGFGSGPIAWCVLPVAYYFHHECHEAGCYRMGHPNSDGKIQCRKHILRREND